MTGRLNNVYSLPSNIFSEGCPVVISAGALYTDVESGKVLAQLKLKNISDKEIASCKISVRAFENNGDELQGAEGFSYLDLNAAPGSEFGSKVPIFMPDSTTRSISVVIEEIVYSDKNVQKLYSQEWKPVPTQKTVAETMADNDIVEQIKIDYGTGIDYMPIRKNGLFLCSCGSVNDDSNNRCYKCQNSYDDLIKMLDKDELNRRLSERLEREAAEKEAERKRLEEKKEADRIKKEEQLKKAKASGKKAVKIIAAIAIAVVVAYIAKIAITGIMTANKYSQANQLYDSKEFAQAIEQYDELGDYKDASDRKAASYANLAVQDLEKNDYENANLKYKHLNNYKFENDEWQNEANKARAVYYKNVVSLADNGDFNHAIDLLNNISDTEFNEYLQYCRSERALQLVNENKLDEAKAYLLACEKTAKFEKEREDAYSKYYAAAVFLIKDKKFDEGSKLMKDLGYEESAKYYEYCNLGLTASNKLDNADLSGLYNKIAILSKDFKLGKSLIDDNKYLSEISSLEGTWKAKGSLFVGEMAEKHQRTVATVVVKDGKITLTDDSYIIVGNSSDRDTEYFFTVDGGKLVVVPEYDFTEAEDGYDFDSYDVTLKDGVFSFHYHNGDVDFIKD